jgi:hypothetical protein
VRAVATVILASVALSGTAHAQCLVPKESNEAKLLAFSAVPIAFSPAGNLSVMSAGSVRLSFDASYVPTASDDLNRTSLCFLQDKEENTRLSAIFPRPRIALGLGAGFFVEASYLPPVTVMDAQPNLGSVALGYVRAVGERTANGSGMTVALRAHSTFGKVKGPITCPSDALQQQDPNKACFGSAPSKDTYKPNLTGVEAALGWEGSGRLGGYVGAGYSSLDPRFQVGFNQGDGFTDSTRVQPDGRMARFTAMLGGRFKVGPRAAITGELYSVPKDVTTFRLGASYALRGGL